MAARFRAVATEWHPVRNGDLRPEQVTPGSDKKVWWRCGTCNWEWQAVVANRALKATSCPRCVSSISKEEYARLASMLEPDGWFHQSLVEGQQIRVGRRNVDWWHPRLNLVVQYNGCYWHDHSYIKPDCRKGGFGSREADERMRRDVLDVAHGLLELWSCDSDAFHRASYRAFMIDSQGEIAA